MAEGVAQVRYDGCLPACVATLLGCEVDRLPTVDFALDSPQWFEKFSAEVADATGFELMSLRLDREPRGFWIAVVPGRAIGQHAVVMRADELVWDPYRERPRSSVERSEIELSIVAVPLDPRRCLTSPSNLCTVSGSVSPRTTDRRIE